MKSKVPLLIIFVVLCQACTTYNELPKIDDSIKISEGIYSNNSCYNNDEKRETSLWKIVDFKNEIKNENLKVKVELIDTETLLLSFFKDSVEVGKEKIRGKFKDDYCFYSKRNFYVVPILPILWWYSNEQKRFYKIDNQLIVEAVKNKGGAFIFMAGGNNYNNLWKFNSLSNQ